MTPLNGKYFDFGYYYYYYNDNNNDNNQQDQLHNLRIALLTVYNTILLLYRHLQQTEFGERCV